jgi:hypothetical protein
MVKHIEELFDAIVQLCLVFVKTKCQEYQDVPENSVVISLMKVFKAFLQEYHMMNMSYVQSLK